VFLFFAGWGVEQVSVSVIQHKNYHFFFYCGGYISRSENVLNNSVPEIVEVGTLLSVSGIPVQKICPRKNGVYSKNESGTDLKLIMINRK